MKRGRPKKPPAECRSKIVSFRVREDQLAAGKAKAGEKSVCEWARDLYLRGLRTG